MKTEKEQAKEIEREIRDERNRESQEGYFDSWKKDNLKHLKDTFIEEKEDEFDEFCKEEFKEYENT